jgi:hypothetical protein
MVRPGDRQGVGQLSKVRSKVFLAAGISAVVAIGVTGCGEAKQLTAKQQVTKGLSAFDSANSAAFTISLDTTLADLEAISAAEGDPMKAADKREVANVLAGKVILDIQEPDGKTFGDAQKAGSGVAGQSDLLGLLDDPAALSAQLKKSGAFGASVQLSGSSLFDIRSIGGVIYLRADVSKILKLAGQDPAALTQELSALPPSMSSLAVAAQGKWVSIDLVKAATAAKKSGVLKALPTPSATPSLDPAKVQKLIADLKAAYQQKATIASIGSDPAKGEGYRLSAPAKQVAEAISGDLIAVIGSTSGAEVKKSISQIPDKTFNLDLWVKDDKLDAVAIDLTQFLDKPVTGKKLALDIGVEVGGGSVSAPSGATAIDVASILSQIPPSAFSGLSGLTGGSAPSGGGASTPTLTKAQIKALKQSGLSNSDIKKLLEAQSKSKG